MSKPGRGGKGRRGSLSDDDESVWAHTASTLKPLRRGKPRVHPAIDPDEPVAGFAPAPEPRGPHHGRSGSTPESGSPASHTQGSHTQALRPSVLPRPAAVPALQPFDVKRARRVKSGRIEIDARLDLHGLQQSEAHAALSRFLSSCQANGLRTVLVITGKGGSAVRRVRDDDVWGRGADRGILKRNVPLWLAEPELRRIVVSYTDAAVRHGGEGALYIHLRSNGKAQPDR